MHLPLSPTDAAEAQLVKELDSEVACYRLATFSTSTKSTYSTHYRVYLDFCSKCGYLPVPITSDKLCRYAAFLARTRKFSTVKQYINIVRILHLENGLSNPLENNYFLRSVLLGIKRTKGDAVKTKLPITPEVLHRIRLALCLQDAEDSVFWAICLVAFFGLFRKGNLLLKSDSLFDPLRHLRRRDFCLCPSGIEINVRWTKTIQFRQRVLKIPLPNLPNHPLCPVRALLKAFSFIPNPSLDAPPFLLSFNQKNFVSLTQSKFSRKLTQVLSKVGYDSSLFSGHSFRRGGATWALQCGFPSDVIKILGDWRSDAYLRYIDISPGNHTSFSRTFGASLPVA
jgi:integrase